jgi:hypothetical protein
MLQITQCPQCRRDLSVPEEMIGRETRCSTCGHTFKPALVEAASLPAGPPHWSEPRAAAAAPADAEVVVIPLRLSLDDAGPALTQKIPPPPGPLRLVPLDGKPDQASGPRRDFAMPCPYCGAGLPPDAYHCRFCGEILDDDREPAWDRRAHRPPFRRDYEPHRGHLILGLGIVGLVFGPAGLPFAIAAWTMANKDLAKMQMHTMEPEGKYVTRDGKYCGIAGVVVGGLSLLVVLATMFRF